MCKIRRLFSSVFVKLLLVCLAAWLLITVAVSALFIVHRLLAGVPYNPLVEHYLEYLLPDIAGQPEEAARLAARLGIGIDYRNSEVHWSKGRQEPPKRLHFFPAPNNDMIAYAFRHDIMFIRYQHPTGTYLFTLPKNQEPKDWLQSHLHLLALIIIAVIFTGAYFLIRRILAPLATLHDATRKIAQGDLGHAVQVSGNGELAKLADSFNDMVRRLREMIAAKEQLLRDVSHELRSPLTRIKVLLEMVEPRERAEQIASDIRELEELITGILETARDVHNLDRLKMEEVDLRELVAEVIDRQGIRAQEVELAGPEGSVRVRLDRHLFTRVIDNLLVNALTHGQPADGPVRVRVAEENGSVLLAVTDSGPGIAEQDLPHLMEPFYRADKSRSREKSGFGLGLSLCRTIVEAHGGELVLTSRPGQGAEALVRLPLKTKE
ncbi:MAG: hypothetical protein A2X81_13205 [Desulfobacterales bacterium GWB2_56_26]|nr:MAG: hypothetical protein A2X81_13205 [Desulfobacterales bacterium GWB2_56_26]